MSSACLRGPPIHEIDDPESHTVLVAVGLQQLRALDEGEVVVVALVVRADDGDEEEAVLLADGDADDVAVHCCCPFSLGLEQPDTEDDDEDDDEEGTGREDDLDEPVAHGISPFFLSDVLLRSIATTPVRATQLPRRKSKEDPLSGSPSRERTPEGLLLIHPGTRLK
jgi:hypothetical protein